LALLDILGFRKIVAMNKVETVALMLKGLEREVARNAHHPLVLSSSQPPVRFLLYSDSILLYIEDEDRRSITGLVQATKVVIGVALFDGLMLRGAITKGELFVSGNRQVFAGRGLVRAYDLERNQGWAGAVIDRTTIGATPAEAEALDACTWLGFVRRAAVPRQEGSATEIVLDWTNRWGGPSATVSILERKLRGTMGEPDARAKAKQDATWEFMRKAQQDPENVIEREAARRRLLHSLRGSGELASWHQDLQRELETEIV
jgi:hypothetical protein